MKIPESVRIGGVQYAVQYEERLINDEGRALCGQISYDNAVIKLEPKVQCPQGMCQTLLHEIFHGIAHHFKMDLTEDQVDILANGMYMVIADNPEIF